MKTPLINRVDLNGTIYDLDLTDKEFEANLLNSVAFLALLLRVAEGMGGGGSILPTVNDSKMLTVYSVDIDTTPSGGDYNWETEVLLAPALWSAVKTASSTRMAYGIAVKATDSITWGDPMNIGGFNGEGGTTEPTDLNNFKLLSIYRAIKDSPGKPTGGTFTWPNTLVPPTGWVKVKPTSDHIWMSLGLGLKDTTIVDWSEPVLISNIIFPQVEGGSEGILVTCYKNGVTVTKPASNLGSYDWESEEFTPPYGWSKEKSTPPEGQFTWQVFGFVQKGVDSISWGDPVLLGLGGNGGTIVIPNFKFKECTVFTGSVDTPTKPNDSDGSYDFNTDTFVPPTGWKANRSEVTLADGEYRWLTRKIFFNNGEDGGWSTPILDIDAEGIKNNPVAPFGLAWAYIESTERPETPTSDLGVYDYDSHTLTVPPAGWKTSVENCTKDDDHIYIWETTRVFLQGRDTNWSTPSRYWDGDDIINDSSTNTKTFGFAIYKGTASDTNTLAAPSNSEGTFNIETKSLTPPEGWDLTPAAAKTTYGDFCKVWVSFNNYIVDYIDGIAGTPTSTGWTTPIAYIDIGSILSEAEGRAVTIANLALEDAQGDLTDALARLKENDAYIDAVINSLAVLYSWQNVTNYNQEDVIETPEGVTDYESLVATCTGSIYYDKVIIIGENAYKYTAYAVSLTTQLSDLLQQLNTETGRLENLINTAVVDMTPEQIRLAVSKGYLDYVTWVKVDALPDNLCIVVNQLPTKIEDVLFGSVYKTAVNLDGEKEVAYYRADYPSSTGFLNILNDSLNLGIAKRSDGKTDSATLEFYFGETGSTAALTAKTIVLNGDVIASAIAAKSLNINNTTFLDADGNLQSGMGNGKAGNAFWANGTGYIAGGKIIWGPKKEGTILQGQNLTATLLSGEFAVKVSGTIEANSGYFGPSSAAGWTIGLVNDGSGNKIASLYGKSSTGETIRIQPDKIYSKDSRNNTYWLFSAENGGYVSIANGAFEAGLGVGGAPDNVYGVSVKGHIEANSGYLGSLDDETKGWTIGTYGGEGGIYTGSPTGKHMAITPSSIRAGNTAIDAWHLDADGTGALGYGFINWKNNLAWIGGWKVLADTIDGGFTHLNSSGQIYNDNNNVLRWSLNADGSGSLAKGNISWTKEGKLTITGVLTKGDQGEPGPQGEQGPKGDPGKNGSNGKDGSTVATMVALLYKRSSTALTSKPSRAVDYYFDGHIEAGSNNLATSITNLGGWSPTIPDGTNEVYILQRVITGDPNDYVTILPNEWIGPRLLAEKGPSGSTSSITDAEWLSKILWALDNNATTIDGSHIIAGTVSAALIKALNITSDKIAANAIVAGKIAAGAVTANTIAAGEITVDKLNITGVGTFGGSNSNLTLGGWKITLHTILSTNDVVEMRDNGTFTCTVNNTIQWLLNLNGSAYLGAGNLVCDANGVTIDLAGSQYSVYLAETGLAFYDNDVPDTLSDVLYCRYGLAEAYTHPYAYLGWTQLCVGETFKVRIRTGKSISIDGVTNTSHNITITRNGNSAILVSGGLAMTNLGIYGLNVISSVFTIDDTRKTGSVCFYLKGNKYFRVVWPRTPDPVLTFGVDGILTKVNGYSAGGTNYAAGYANGLFYNIVESEEIAQAASKANSNVLYLVPEGTTSTSTTRPGYSSSNRTGRR